MSGPRFVRFAGWAGFVGVAFFLLSISVLQVFRSDVDFARHYVSDFVNGPGGWLFVVATLVHGLGNLAIALGIGRSLASDELRPEAPTLLAMSAIGILVAGVFPTDPANAPATWPGFVHGAAVTVSFVLELAALFLFAATFRRNALWSPSARSAFVLAILATAGLTLFVVLRGLSQLEGLGERAALIAFVAWELWASLRLIRSGRSGAFLLDDRRRRPRYAGEAVARARWDAGVAAANDRSPPPRV